MPASQRYPALSREATFRRRRTFALTILVLLIALVIGLSSWWITSGRYVAAPSVINLTQGEAQGIVDEAGLTISFSEQYSEDVPTDLVISSDPAPGDKVVRGSAMSAVVSLGPERYGVPQLAGLTLDDAKQALAEANLVAGQVSGEWSETVASGLVVSSGYGAGEQLKRDTPVDLAISKGREPLNVPNVVDKPKDEAAKTITDLGFQVAYSDEKVDAKVPAGSVISQDPANGSGYRGDTITLVISKGANMTKVPAPKSSEKPAAYSQRLTDAKFAPELVYSGANLGPNVGKIAKVTDEDGNILSADSELPEGSKVKVYVTL